MRIIVAESALPHGSSYRQSCSCVRIAPFGVRSTGRTRRRPDGHSPIHRGIGRVIHSSSGDRNMATKKRAAKKGGRKGAAKKGGRKSARKGGARKKSARKSR
jgi:hypothetical protein